jgi:hypothetical protein
VALKVLPFASTMDAKQLQRFKNEAHIKDLPRLRFRFDRRSLGRLRQLIDLLNREIE